MIRRDHSDGWTLITIDRPERANALDADHCRGLTDALASCIERDDRAVVITGQGSSFCAGADFGGVHADGFHAAHRALLQALLDAPMPIIAAINGHAIGAGMQLAIASDLRVVADAASFAIPTARLGLAVDPWTIERLASLIGGGPARRVLFTCDRIPADDPAIAGLVDRRGDLAVATSLAEDLATMAPLTLRYIKATLNEVSLGNLQSDRAHQAFRAIWDSRDSGEGLAARRDGRTPRFTGT